MSCQHQRLVLFAVLSGLLASGPMSTAQSAPPGPSAPPQTAAPAPAAEPAKGGILQGHVKSGNAPIPGVGVTATNTLTGKKYTTTTDVSGAFKMNIPQNGRYVLKTDLAAFSPATKEALLNATAHEQTVDFEIVLASKAQQTTTQEEARSARQYTGTGAQSLSLANALGEASDASEGSGSSNAGSSGAQLPTMASNSDFASSESVAITGQTGNTSPFANFNADQMREDFENRQQQDSLSQIPGQSSERSGGPGGGSPGGGGPGGGGPGGGFGGGMMGGRGGGSRMGSFRKFRADQPHGAIFWSGGNSALDALPFAINGTANGQKLTQAPYSSNHYGLTIMGEPYLPKLTKPSGKDTFFLNISGQRASNQVTNTYANVPTVAERGGDFTNLLSSSGSQITIYDPTTGKQFLGDSGTPNQIPSQRISAQAKALLNYIPTPNTTSSSGNYYLLQTQQSNNITIGARYMRTIGNNVGGGRRTPAFLAQFSNSNGLRQNFNVNFNYSHTASDSVNIFPQLGGKTFSDGYSTQVGYVIGRGKLSNNISLGWNRSNGQTQNFFTNGQDVASSLGIHDTSGESISTTGLNYGLPKITMSQFTGLSQTQPSVRVQQTISISDNTSWRHGKHNFRFGGDFRRIHQDMLSSSNATGTLYFTGFATQNPAASAATTTSTTSGSAFADFLLGSAQESTIQAPLKKAYTRANSWTLFAQDDFRVRSNLSLVYGLRYEYFSPYSEKYNRMAIVDPNSTFSAVDVVYPNSTGTYRGKYSQSLIYPFRVGFSPRFGVAYKPMKDTVIRGGYGLNFTNGQYNTIVRSTVYQPPFANVQTNQADNTDPSSAISLATPFAPATSTSTTKPTFAINPHYRLPYVQVWNVNIQRTLPKGIVLNAGYNGAKGSNLDITTAPGRAPDGTPYSGAYFNYEDSPGFSNFHAATVSANKRMQKGISMGATYTYSHGIDNAGSVGGTSTVVAQNWQNLKAEESNSSFDQRHKISGTYIFELPFGPDKAFFNGGGLASQILRNFLISGNFAFATGTPLTPKFTASVSDVAQGTAGSQRPDRVAGQSITAGAGSAARWFNTSAFTTPTKDAAGYQYGNASRNSITGPGTVTNNMSLSKTLQLGDTRSCEMRATANNVFNTVQYSGVDSNIDSTTAGAVTSAASMRKFTFSARFRF